MIEFIEWGVLADISMFIHLPLFGAGFSGYSSGGVIAFLFFWYGAIIGTGTYLTYYLIQAISNK
jgi:hypothetical protein